MIKPWKEEPFQPILQPRVLPMPCPPWGGDRGWGGPQSAVYSKCHQADDCSAAPAFSPSLHFHPASLSWGVSPKLQRLVKLQLACRPPQVINAFRHTSQFHLTPRFLIIPIVQRRKQRFREAEWYADRLARIFLPAVPTLHQSGLPIVSLSHCVALLEGTDLSPSPWCPLCLASAGHAINIFRMNKCMLPNVMLQGKRHGRYGTLLGPRNCTLHCPSQGNSAAGAWANGCAVWEEQKKPFFLHKLKLPIYHTFSLFYVCSITQSE